MSARDELYRYADDAHLGGEYLDELLGRVEAEAVARVTGRPVNETLVAARAHVGLLLEAETGERFPQWRVIITDSESPTGFAPVCTAEGVDDEHHVIADYPGGPIRDEHGVYDCCPSLQVETYSPTLAAYLVEVLNADTEAPGAVARGSEKDTRGESPQQGESTPEPPRPHALPESSFARARACERIGGFFRCARIGHAETAGAQ